MKIRKKAFKLLSASRNQCLAKEITNISDSALGVLCKRAFLPGDVNITLILRSYFKCWLLQMSVKSSSSRGRSENVFHTFQNSSWFDGEREKGMGGSRRDKGRTAARGTEQGIETGRV